MSVIPYNSQNKLVYHDPVTEIAIVHDRQNGKVRFVAPPPKQYPRGPATCPHCGSDLRGYKKGHQSSFSYTDHASDYNGDYMLVPENYHPIRQNSVDLAQRSTDLAHVSDISFPLQDLTPGTAPEQNYLRFVHQDYFKLLSGLNHDLRLLEAETERLSQDVFNQGYFERFFRKIPPYVLGSGAHAHVYKVQHVLKNVSLGVFAVKRINIGDHSKYLDHVLNEVLILYEISSSGASANNLIRYNHVWMELGDLQDHNTFIVPPENSDFGRVKIPYVYILQQYCAGGNLETMVGHNFPPQLPKTMKERAEERRRQKQGHAPKAARWLSDLETWKFFHDIATGVHFLHQNNILHRDLKPSNCLLETEYKPSASKVFTDMASLDAFLSGLPRVLVSDFGEGKFIDKSKTPEIRMGNTGTVEFADPKLWVYDNVKNYTHPFTYSCDMYSLGLVLCYLCVGSSPFSQDIVGMDDPEAIRSVISNWYKNLSKNDFLKWIKAESLRVRGAYTDCTNDLAILAYAMLTGDADSNTVLLQMGQIKQHFLQQKTVQREWVHTGTVIFICDLIILEFLDAFQASYFFKLLKVLSVAGLVFRGDIKSSACLLFLIIGVGARVWSQV